MRWFGPGWNAPVCEEGEQVPTPDDTCRVCGTQLLDGTRGLVLVSYGAKWCSRCERDALNDPCVCGEREEQDYPIHLSCLLQQIGVPV